MEANNPPEIKLHFPAVPDGEPIALLSEHEHRLPLAPVSFLLAYLQPVQFPTDLLEEIWSDRFPQSHVPLLQIIKLELLLMLWILMWLLLSLSLLYRTIAKMCCWEKKLHRLRDHHSSVSSTSSRIAYCKGPVSLSIAIHSALLIYLVNLLLMLASNEQTSRSLASLPIKSAVAKDDLEKFVRNTEMQITFVTATSLETAAKAFNHDLDEADRLLGKPIMDWLDRTYNLQEIFEHLRDIQQDSFVVVQRSSDLIRECLTAEEAGKALQTKIDELIAMFKGVHQICADTDVTLCESLSASGLDVAFDTSEVVRDSRIKYLASLEKVEFNRSLQEVEVKYKGIPRRISAETESQRTAIREALESHRIDIHKQLRSLEESSRSSISSIKKAFHAFEPYLDDIVSGDSLRYLTTLVIAMILFAGWMFLSCGSPCGSHRNSHSQTGEQHKSPAYLLIGLTLTSTISLVVWMLGSSALLLGVHGQNLICHSLYDRDYKILTTLLDDEGLAFPNGGLFKTYLLLNDTISTRDVLRNMENNKTVYKTFNLKSKLNLNELTEYKKWVDLLEALEGLDVRRDLKVLSGRVENTLHEFSAAAKLNLTAYRVKYSRTTTGKDLNAFLDQIYSTTKHIRDARTRGRLENVTFKLRDIVNNEYKTLNDIQDRIIYHITALEVTLKPLLDKVRYVLLNLTKFQNNVNFQMFNITKQHIINYSARLEDYLAQFRQNVLYEIKQNAAKSGPLWSIFTAVRETVCDGCIDGTNALALSAHIFLTLLFVIQPLVWRIVYNYKESNEDNISHIIRRSASEELIHRPSNWADSSRQRRAQSAETIEHDMQEESIWVSPRQSGVSDVPPLSPRRFDLSPELTERSNWSHQARDISPATRSRHWI